MSVRHEALRIASTQVGVRETGRNTGPEVDTYLASAGLGPGFAWCAAFVYWCFVAGAASVRKPNPCPRTAGAMRMREQAEHWWWPHIVDALPGDVFVIDHGHGLGHVGFVELIREDGTLQTIEGNTAPNGTREGDGVYRRTRKPSEINAGYLRIGS
jgi:hypothetical protein